MCFSLILNRHEQRPPLWQSGSMQWSQEDKKSDLDEDVLGKASERERERERERHSGLFAVTDFTS